MHEVQINTKPQLTLLNFMAGRDFEQALDTHVLWKIKTLDLKNHIFGKPLIDLTDEEAGRASEMIAARGLAPYCFSSELFSAEVECGRESFQTEHLGKVDRLLEVARIIKPEVIRLIAPSMQNREETANSFSYLSAHFPWLLSLFREAVQRIHDAGFKATIENECHACIFTHPHEVGEFFQALDLPGKVFFTWDVQNMWQCGTFPTLEVYRQLKLWIGYYHVKGGQHDESNRSLRWKTSLEDASWPVLEITKALVADGISPFICINPPHGGSKPGYNELNITQRDIDFLRREIPELSL